MEVNQIGVVGIGDIKGGDAAAAAAFQADEGIATSPDRGDRQVLLLRTFVVGALVVVDAGGNSCPVDQIAAVPNHIAEGIENGDRTPTEGKLLLVARGCRVVITKVFDDVEFIVGGCARDARCQFVIIDSPA